MVDSVKGRLIREREASKTINQVFRSRVGNYVCPAG